MNDSNKNSYDNMVVDIDKLFEKKIKIKSIKRPGYFKRFLTRYINAFEIKTGLITPMLESGLKSKWFMEFRDYWYNVLNGRPLYLHDFYFLLGVYRQKFQNVETPDYAEKKEFLESWQNQNTLYQLFGAVRRFSRECIHSRQFEKWIKNGDTVLEYGCGIAPVTYSLVNYSLKRKLNLVIADIRQINFHYAIHRLPNEVKNFTITPYQNSIEVGKYNVVIMITVMEHLPNPLETVVNITKGLKKGGIFIFDYIISDGHAQDTIEAVDQRKDVLDYINQKYTTLYGELSYGQSMSNTVCRLK